MAKYDAITASAALMVKDNLRECEMSIIEGTVELSNIVLAAAAREARKLTPIAKKPYPPSRHRVPGTMRAFILYQEATTKRPGKLIMEDTWLWEWVLNKNAKDTALKAAGRGREVKHHRNIKQGDKSAGRFKVQKEGGKRVGGMIETDPRRLMGQPMEEQIRYVKKDNRLQRVMEKSIAKNEIPQWQMDAIAYANEYKQAWNALYKR